MQNLKTRVAITPFLFLTVASAAMATPSFHSSLTRAVKAIGNEASDEDRTYSWSLPSIVQSGLVESGISVFGSETYAAFHGRTFELRQEQVKLGLFDQLELIYGRQFVHAQGRMASSKFYDDEDHYGARFVVKKPTDEDPSAWSLQFEAMRPGTAQISSGSNAETLAGPGINTYAVNYGDRSNFQYQAAYTSIDAPLIDAHSASVSVGHDLRIASDAWARLQATLVGQSFSGAGESSNFQLREVVSGYVAWNPIRWLSVEGGITVFPSGAPFVSGEFTSVSSFAVYNPGGVVNDLRNDFSAFGTLVVMAHWKF